MSYKQTISVGPEVMDNNGVKTSGFHYSIFEEWGETENDTTYYKSDVEGWTIYPDGTFRYVVNQDTARWCGECQGTFESSRYDVFVQMMKEYKTDWMRELHYDKDTGDFTWG